MSSTWAEVASSRHSRGSSGRGDVGLVVPGLQAQLVQRIFTRFPMLGQPSQTPGLGGRGVRVTDSCSPSPPPSFHPPIAINFTDIRRPQLKNQRLRSLPIDSNRPPEWWNGYNVVLALVRPDPQVRITYNCDKARHPRRHRFESPRRDNLLPDAFGSIEVQPPGSLLMT